MPEPTKIPRPFADSGDKNSIPDSSGSIGFASWQEGFPAITSEPFAQGGVAPKRADFNGIFNALSLATVWQQQGGFYAYDATTDYEIGNVVLYNGDLYKCLAANGPSSAVKAPNQAAFWSVIFTANNLAETGTFTPTVAGSTTTGSFTYTDRVGSYVKIGPLVFIDFSFTAKVVTVPVGNVKIWGIPYTPNSSNQSIFLNIGVANNKLNYTPFMFRVITDGSLTLFGLNTNSNTIQACSFSSVAVDDSMLFRGSGVYRTA